MNDMHDKKENKIFLIYKEIQLRARALRAPVFLGALPRLTGRCAPLPFIAATLILIYTQNFPSGPNSGRRRGVYIFPLV